jgi:hypothetical protein
MAVAIGAIGQAAVSYATTYTTYGATNTLTKYIGVIQGSSILGPATIVDAASGTSYPVLKATLTTTAATSDAVTLTGVTTTSVCVVGAAGATAATNIATTYVSAVAANTVTVTHTATASMVYKLLCSPA